jgi:cytidylate kinase
MLVDLPIIAIDGPSASGKGTVAEQVAKFLGFDYLDSGALYRLSAVAIHKSDTDPHNIEACKTIIHASVFESKQGELWLNNTLVSQLARTESIGQLASLLATAPAIRNILHDKQVNISKQAKKGLVADGRDMGSVIFPHATLKIFLTADLSIRAERRFKQLKQKGEAVTMEAVFSALAQRDEQDTHRLYAPLKQTDDAYFLDTSQLSIEEAVNQILCWFNDVTSSISK